MEVTKKLAEFIAKARVEEMPSEGVKTAKEGMMDCLGCTLLGAVQPIGRIITDFVKEASARPVAAVVGQGIRTSPSLAALANGVMAHAEDYDDMNLVMYGHPSPPLFPAILAVGELCEASGKEVIEAYIIGFEVETRLGAALCPSHYNKGWHGTSTMGTPAAAAASARLLKLDVDQIRMALAIAGSQTSGLRQNFGTMTKPFHAGNAARSGVVAALLAQKGFTADLNIIEAPLGFGNVFRGDEPCHLEKIVDGLGKSFEIVKSGIAFKPWPSCGETHAAIEIMTDLVKQEHISPHDVGSIECVFSATMDSVMLYREPKTALEGKFSVEYCVARALIDGKVSLEDFTDERVNQPEVQEIIKIVRRKVDSSFPMLDTAVTVKLKDGRELSKRVKRPKGWPENPLTHGELAAKYKDCAHYVLSDDEVKRSLELMENLEEVQDISQLTRIVGKL